MEHEWLIKYLEDKKIALPTENIYDITFENDQIEDLFSFLIKASLCHENIYRGVASDKYKIVSSQRLFQPNLCYEEWNTHDDVNDILQEFKNGLNHLSEKPIKLSNLELLEYARHYGVPTPIIDFSYSPFIALFFSCSDFKNHMNNFNIKGKEQQYATLNIINKGQLACGYLRTLKKDPSLGSTDRNKFDGYDKDFCKDSFEDNILQIINAPSYFNKRMKNQQGLFIYDTLNYSSYSTWGNSFEDMILKLPNPVTSYPQNDIGTDIKDVFMPIMIHVNFNINMASRIMTLLDRMNINAFTIYPDETGAAMHARISHYSSSQRTIRND